MHKLAELKIVLEAKKVDIVCINETHYNKEFMEAEVTIPGFNAFRGDRDFKLDRSNCKEDESSDGGGSVIYVRESIKVLDNSHLSILDSTSITIETAVGNILIGCFYRSTSLNEEQNVEFINNFVQSASSKNDLEKVLFGDFNFPNISWISGNVIGPNNSVNKGVVLQQKFVNEVHNAGLSWLITDEITRRRMVGNKLQESTIDQVFSSDDSLITDFNLFSPLGKSDHVSIIVDLNIFKVDQSHSTEVDDVKRNWSKVKLSDLLKFSYDEDWSYSNDPSIMNVEEMWKDIHGKMCEVTNSVPENHDFSGKNSNNFNNMPWINSSLKRAIRAKNKSWELFDVCPTTDNLHNALSKQGYLDKTELKAKLKYEKLITNDLKHNSKAFYSYLRNRRNVKSVVTSLKRANGSVTENDTDTAECFADAFSSVFVNEPHGPLPQCCYKESDDAIGDIGISVDDVYEELKSLNTFKSSGPDNIHPKLLHALADNPNFVRSLTELYHKCSNEGKIPQTWKIANVIALHKKDSKLDPLNYRPVSLTCILCKIYEKLIRRHIVEFVGGKITPVQHGFVDKKSCLSNLLETVDSIIDLLESGCPVDLFYFDFCKAFDSVPHYRLLTKLENYGIKGNMLAIINDFLSGRSLRTCVRGNYSSLRDVLSGVPQGSVLGPLLFVLFVNDLPDCVKNISKLFADDLKLIANAKDKISVNNDLVSLEEWESLWLLKFNPKKCKVMHLNYNNNPYNTYKLDGVVLESIEMEKDLGVTVSHELGWDKNIQSCIKDANRAISWISRNILERDSSILTRIYKTIIRPKLEYCVQLWNPAACHGNWSTILELESIQRRFSRLANDIGLLPYSERLGKMKLTTLGERRIRGDLIETFKIVNRIVDYGKDIFRLSRSGRNIIRESTFTNSNVDSSAIVKLKSSFLPERVRNYWNNLPNFVKSSVDVPSFKANLEIFKRDCLHSSQNNYWEVSNMIIDKIEGNHNYIANKDKFNQFLVDNPFIARKKGINTFIYQTS